MSSARRPSPILASNRASVARHRNADRGRGKEIPSRDPRRIESIRFPEHGGIPVHRADQRQTPGTGGNRDPADRHRPTGHPQPAVDRRAVAQRLLDEPRQAFRCGGEPPPAPGTDNAASSAWASRDQVHRLPRAAAPVRSPARRHDATPSAADVDHRGLSRRAGATRGQGAGVHDHVGLPGVGGDTRGKHVKTDKWHKKCITGVRSGTLGGRRAPRSTPAGRSRTSRSPGFHIPGVHDTLHRPATRSQLVDRSRPPGSSARIAATRSSRARATRDRMVPTGQAHTCAASA